MIFFCVETPTTIDKMHPPILMFNDLKEGEGAFLFWGVQNGNCAQLGIFLIYMVEIQSLVDGSCPNKLHYSISCSKSGRLRA